MPMTHVRLTRHRIARFLLIALPSILAAVLPAGAIVLRHDIDDTACRELARDYTMVCRVGGGMGTLIDPSWVITAAHVADGLPRKAATVRFGETVVPVKAIHIHPDYADEEKHRDLALLELAEPVQGITPARLAGPGEVIGTRVTLVGDGKNGTGLTGPREGPRIMRAARNRVDGTRPGWISFVFDTPPKGEPLEGISGPGDSGGPAFANRDGAPLIVGVSAYNDGDPQCVYGTTELYARVADERDWIDGVMSGKISSEPASPKLLRLSGDGDEQATVSRAEPEVVEVPKAEDARLWAVVEKLVGAFEANDREAFLALFTERRLARAKREEDPLEAMLGFMGQVQRKRGPIAGFHPLGRTGFAIGESAFPMRPVIFHLEDGMPGYLGIAIDDQGRIDHFSLFVMENVCPHGTTCTEARPLRELRGKTNEEQQRPR